LNIIQQKLDSNHKFYKHEKQIKFLKKYIIFFLPILLLAPNAWAEIYVQNDQKYIGDDGVLHIVGEIQNDFDVPVNQINIHATLYSENGDEIKTLTTTSLVNKIMPGMKGPFDFIIVGKEVKMMNYYVLNIDYKITEPKNQVIDITSSESSLLCRIIVSYKSYNYGRPYCS